MRDSSPKGCHICNRPFREGRKAIFLEVRQFEEYVTPGIANSPDTWSDPLSTPWVVCSGGCARKALTQIV